MGVGQNAKNSGLWIHFRKSHLMGIVSVWGLVITSSEKPREIIGSYTHGVSTCTNITAEKGEFFQGSICKFGNKWPMSGGLLNE